MYFVFECRFENQTVMINKYSKNAHVAYYKVAYILLFKLFRETLFFDEEVLDITNVIIVISEIENISTSFDLQILQNLRITES